MAVPGTEAAGRPTAAGDARRGSDPAVELDGLGRAYGERVVLRDVTLVLEPGRTLLVLGPNGAGKSTLLRILATLLRPHAGRARVLAHELPREGWAVRGRIGLLAHEPLLYRDLSGRENLRYQARLFGAPEARVGELLERVGMARRADEPVRTLSRGMVQRLAICRTVLHRPELLVQHQGHARRSDVSRDAQERSVVRGLSEAPRDREDRGHGALIK